MYLGLKDRARARDSAAHRLNVLVRPPIFTYLGLKARARARARARANPLPQRHIA